MLGASEPADPSRCAPGTVAWIRERAQQTGAATGLVTQHCCAAGQGQLSQISLTALPTQQAGSFSQPSLTGLPAPTAAAEAAAPAAASAAGQPQTGTGSPASIDASPSAVTVAERKQTPQQSLPNGHASLVQHLSEPSEPSQPALELPGLEAQPSDLAQPPLEQQQGDDHSQLSQLSAGQQQQDQELSQPASQLEGSYEGEHEPQPQQAAAWSFIGQGPATDQAEGLGDAQQAAAWSVIGDGADQAALDGALDSLTASLSALERLAAGDPLA